MLLPNKKTMFCSYPAIFTKKKHAQNGRIKGKVLYYKNLKVRKYSVFTYENIKQFLIKFFL